MLENKRIETPLSPSVLEGLLRLLPRGRTCVRPLSRLLDLRRLVIFDIQVLILDSLVVVEGNLDAEKVLTATGIIDTFLKLLELAVVLVDNQID